MKLVAIVGTNAKQSYNRSLLQFMQRHFATKADIEILEITDVPMFNETEDQTDTSFCLPNRKIIALSSIK